MSETTKTKFKVGDKVFAEQHDCKGVVKHVELGDGKEQATVFTVALENGQTRHYLEEDLKSAK